MSTNYLEKDWNLRLVWHQNFVIDTAVADIPNSINIPGGTTFYINLDRRSVRGLTEYWLTTYGLLADEIRLTVDSASVVCSDPMVDRYHAMFFNHTLQLVHYTSTARCAGPTSMCVSIAEGLEVLKKDSDTARISEELRARYQNSILRTVSDNLYAIKSNIELFERGDTNTARKPIVLRETMSSEAYVLMEKT